MDKESLDRRISAVLKNAGVGIILLVNTNSEDPNFIYMTDLRGGLFEGNFLLISKKGATLFTSPLEYELAKGQLSNKIKIVNLDSTEKVELLERELKGKEIGINGNFLPYNSLRRIKKRFKLGKIVDVSNAFEEARRIKDNGEISRIRMANKITKNAIAKVQAELKVGMTEKEVARRFGNYILEYGADGTSFDSIVCFGKNSALPHHAPDMTKLKHGDLVLIDVGVKVGNYCSDVTRTIIFGDPKVPIKDYEKKKRIIQVVKEAQAAAIASIKQGVAGKTPHLVASGIIDRADGGAYKGSFIHSLGHSIGIEVHDGSGRFLSPESELVLKAGMVSSVEPGIYIPGFGGARIEDDVLVTENGALIL
ncbi:MAG: Xaa-Pro peptidase family protein [Candidatus Micrarchaeaceae archaeon]